MFYKIISFILYIHAYCVCGGPLERVMVIRDLGVIADRKLPFNTHNTVICTQGFIAIGFIMSSAISFGSITVRYAIIALHFAFVRSKLEYNATVCDPHETKYKVILEKVQSKLPRTLYIMYEYYSYLFPFPLVSGMVGMDTFECTMV